MKFSICIPSHRIDRRLINTLESLKSLRGNREVCLSLEGEFSESNLSQVRHLVDSLIVNKDCENISIAKNRALQMGSGDWKVLLDSDDFLLSSTLENFEKAHQVHQYTDVVFVPDLSVIVNGYGSVVNTHQIPDFKEKTKNFLEQYGAAGRPVFFNASLKDPYDVEYEHLDERGLALKFRSNIQILEMHCYVYNVNNNSVSKGSDIKESEELLHFRSKAEIAAKDSEFEVTFTKIDVTSSDQDLADLRDFSTRERSVKNKYAVVTMTIGDFYNKMAAITHPTIKAYADKIGADFIIWKDHEGYETPHYKKLDLGVVLDTYDRVIFVDTDILIREDAPNLLSIVPRKEIGAFNEGRFLPREAAMRQFMYESKLPNPEKWNKKYYNTGVLVVSREHKHIFQRPLKEVNNFYEQTYLNALMFHWKIKMFDLSYKFNRMYALDHITGEDRHDSYFMHYAGVSVNLPKDEQLTLMKNDLKVWSDSKPTYKFKKNIAITVEGGLGDQIAAEPTIRWARDHVYKGDNVIVLTDWPELFTHLELPTYTKKELIPEYGKYFKCRTMNTPEHVSWEFMSHPIVHCVDFASLQALRCTIPMENKQPRLPIDPEAMKSLDEKLNGQKLDIIIHAGKGWPSKTFPADVWQSYIDVLVDNGFKVGVFGKRISSEQGVVEVDTSRCVDLIDKISVSEMVCLISKVPVLLSNDSSPIHIAGAFDNHIGLIATCKNPEFILHWRNGSQFYKAKNLEIKKMYFDYPQQPSIIDGVSIDQCTEERMRECLPIPEEILAFVRGSLT